MADKTERGIIKECDELVQMWLPSRNKKFKVWYELLRMKDKLAQEGMESFVSNDPRTQFNMALHMLDGNIPHRIPTDDLEPLEIEDANKVNELLAYAWIMNDRKYRFRGHESWVRYLTALMLATGWYSVYWRVSDDECIAEVWNPAQVFPDLGDDGLSSVVRKYIMNERVAKNMADKKGWKVGTISGNTTLYNYWYHDAGVVHNAIVLNDKFAKPPTPETQFKNIPILTGPVGGLPDDGSIMNDADWKKEIGQSFLATNEKVFDQMNKNYTFTSQLLRDTAQTRWFERSSEGAILNEADMYKRGAIFRGGINDTVEPLGVPPIPIELRTERFDIQSMAQRGGFSWALTGNIQGQVTGYLIAQLAASVQQMLKPYHDAIMWILEEIDNSWIITADNYGFKPYDMEVPKLAPKYRVSTKYDIKIPGDLVQRATVARMLDPDFEISAETTTKMLFPEIESSLKEQARARADTAMKSPESLAVNKISAFKAAAQIARDGGHKDMADLYDKAADMLEKQLVGQQEQQPAPQQPAIPGPRPEAAPRNAAAANLPMM